MEEINQDKIYYIPVEYILPNRFQPRLAFDEKELNDLANSILKYGVIQPIVLRKISDKYEIIAGERRYKAACLAGLKTIPAIINNTDDNTSAEIALLENLQRKNLTAIEEAQSYKKLIDKGFTQEDIANKLSVSQSSIANKLRLLNLPKEVRDALLYNQISERHARSLLSLNNEDLQKSLLRKIINEKLTVKQTEDEISLLLMKNVYHKQENIIPEDIQRFLRPEVVHEKFEPNDKVDEILDIKVPEVVNIESNDEEIKLTEVVSNNEEINPFIPHNEKVTNRLPIDYESNYETVNYNKNKLNNLPNIIDSIRNYISKLNIENNSKINTTELDLNDKYQIIIEIDKSANN